MTTPRPCITVRNALVGAAAVLSLVFSAASRADERGTGAAATPLYAQECGACHMAYPAGMLPAASWQRLMGSLSRHYGVDASLEPALQSKIAAWLASHAGTYRRVAESPPQDRITLSPWFTRKHHEVAPATFKRSAIGSASNCLACHRGADRGDFDEDAVRIPK